MQGYILNTQKVRDEDLIVTILTKNSIKTLYRFYGARHSIIHLGHKIDFEEEVGARPQIVQLRNVTHLGFKLLYFLDKLQIWQQFIKLSFKHLKDVDNISNFYYHLLDDLSKKMEKQNPKRASVESYIALLEYEGRLHSLDRCFFCAKVIEDENLSLCRAFLPAHRSCNNHSNFDKNKLKYLFSNKNAILLDEDSIERGWEIIQEGF